MNKKKLLTAALIIGIFAAGWVTFFNKVSIGKEEAVQPNKKKQPRKVAVSTMEASAISQTLELTGSVEPYRIARLASPAQGPVASIRVREGDHVKTGEKLAGIGRKKGIDAEIFSLKEELKKEEDNLNRTRKLVENQALPGEQLDQAKAVYEKAHANLVKAQETAEDFQIRAPWEGVISRVNVREGEFVAPRAVILEMYDPTSLVIYAAVPEAHAPKVTNGMTVKVALDAFAGEFIQGRISRVYPYLDTNLRTRTIEISLTEQKARPVQLLPGMFARLELILKKDDEAMIVPVSALVSTKKGDTVFVVEEGKAVARMVKTGIEQENRIQIISGIFPGDQVIVAGNEKLKNGISVRISGKNQSGEKGNKAGKKGPREMSGKLKGKEK